MLDIQLNFQKQRIYPTEVYRGYEKVNQYRREHGQWWSRGDGAKSFEGTVYQANEETGELTVGIRYNDYLKFVDIGVGLTGNPHDPEAHITADKVDRARKAKYNTRYIRKRYENHLADYYGWQAIMQIAKALEDDGIERE